MAKKLTITVDGSDIQSYRQSDEIVVANDGKWWSVYHLPSGKWLRSGKSDKGYFKQKREAVDYAAHLLAKLNMNFTDFEGFENVNPKWQEFV
jgi:hypothetical protein